MGYIYVDNNVLRHLFQVSEDQYNEILKPVWKMNIFPDGSYKIKSSVYLVLEAIGIRPTFIKTIKTPSKYVEKILDASIKENRKLKLDEVENLLMELFESYKVLIESSLYLQKNHLEQKIAEQEGFVGAGSWLFNEVVKLHTEDIDDYIGTLSEWFSLDRVLSQNYPKSIRRDVFAYLINTANKFFEDFRGNSFAKIYFLIGDDLISDTFNKSRNSLISRSKFVKQRNLISKKKRTTKRRLNKIKVMEKKLEIRKDSMNLLSQSFYGNARDTVDAEIVHKLLFGGITENDRTPKPVVVLSADRIEIVALRLALYKNLVHLGRKLVSSENLDQANGYFFQFDPATRRLTKFFNAKNIPPLFGIIDSHKNPTTELARHIHTI